jgi:probable HAF family extracellular repeat protein
MPHLFMSQKTNEYEIAQRFLILSREEQRVIFVSRCSQTTVGFGGKPSDSFDAVGAGHREQRAESGFCEMAEARMTLLKFSRIVGYASPTTGSVHAFLYSVGKMTDLGVFFDSSAAEAINTSGVVIGQADVLNSNGTTEFPAFIYSGGKLQDLNNLIPSGSGWVLTEATGINDKGQIVCDAYNATTGSTHAFLLNPN